MSENSTTSPETLLSDQVATVVNYNGSTNNINNNNDINNQNINSIVAENGNITAATINNNNNDIAHTAEINRGADDSQVIQVTLASPDPPGYNEVVTSGSNNVIRPPSYTQSMMQNDPRFNLATNTIYLWPLNPADTDLSRSNQYTRTAARTLNLREARQARRLKHERIRNLALIASSLIVALFCILFGTIFFTDCPTKPRIPLYLLIMGVLLTITASSWALMVFLKLKILTCCPRSQTTFLFILGIIDVVWLIVGTFWTMGIVNSVTFKDPSLSTYCNKTLYIGSYVFSLSAIIVLILLTCVLLSRDGKPSGAREH